MNLRLKVYDLMLKTLVCFSMTLILNQAHAQDEATEELTAESFTEVASAEPVEDYREEASDLVELHIPIEVNAPYKDRRQTHGFMFSLGYENVLLDRYVSVIDDTTFYQDMVGESEFPVYNMNLSYKFNFILGSIALSGGVGYGSISSDGSGVDRSISLTKQMASASYIMDNILDEPYIAPYITGGVMNVTLEETAAATSVSGELSGLVFMQAGLLFQLNWLEDSVARKALVDSGLENTYLDVFMAKYEPSSLADDPDTSTDYMIGAGFRLEY